MDQFNSQNLGAGAGYTPMQIPDSFGAIPAGVAGVPVTPGAAGTYTPMQLPTTSPGSFTHMPDGSWADAQVSLSSAATTPAPLTNPDGSTPAPGSEEEQIALMKRDYEAAMEIENMMFQQQMMQMQQRAMMDQRALMAARAKMNQPDNNTKLSTGPEIKMDWGDDGGDGGGGEE